jgi:hypothetical protein
VMSGRGDYEVVIEFDAWATDQLRGRLWHSSQQVTELPGGGSRLRMRLSGLEEVERWVLSWGDTRDRYSAGTSCGARRQYCAGVGGSLRDAIGHRGIRRF